MRIIDGIPVFGTSVDEGALKQIKMCREHEAVRGVALMADHHKGYAVPIGGVVAYEDAISPSGVGYDIGCGNKAVRLDMTPFEAQIIKDQIGTIMDEVWDKISFGIGRKNATEVDHPLFESPLFSEIEALRGLKDLARQQLGTVGSGNHYVDIFEDEEGRIWVGCHFGSRGLGHKTATWFLRAGGAQDGMDVPPLVLPVDSDLGQQYIAAMRLAGQYAYAGRNWVCQKVADIIGAPIVEEVHNHHNFAWLESHGGKEVWVVRKGATPAFPGQKGFVGASMAEPAVIIEGVGVAEGAGNDWKDLNELAFYSTIHGAGRVMGRMEAKGKSAKFGKLGRPGKVTNAMMQSWLLRSGIELRGSGLDESPDCYKRLPEVLEAQGPTIRVLHTLRPLGVAMAGPDTHDPYKD